MLRFLHRRFPAAVALLMACGILGNGLAAAAPIRLATFRCDATPPLGGHPLIWVDKPAEISDPLWAKGIILDDGEDRYVIAVLDWCGLGNSSHRSLCERLAAAVSTDRARVTLHCVHQHTAPYTDGSAQRVLNALPDPPAYVDYVFLDQLSRRIAAAAAEAVNRLEPIDQVGAGQAKVERIASCRRVPGPDGKMQVRYSLVRDPALRDAPEGAIDPYLKTVTLARAGKPLVRLHYYATHPQTFYGKGLVSADFVGFARERQEKQEGVFQLYFTGCAGDITVGKYNEGTPESREAMAVRLQTAMQAAIGATEYQPLREVTWRTAAVRLVPRSDKGYSLEDARAIAADPKKPVVSRVRAAVRVAYHGRAEEPFLFSSVALGSVRLLHLPGECMNEYQRFAQSVAPGKFVAVAAYGDVGPGYICTAAAYGEGGYEPTASQLPPEAEQIMKAAIRRLLAEPSASSNP